MIPYFEIGPLQVGPLQIHSFGVLVATGILLGANRVRARHRQFGIPDEYSSALATAIVVSGFIGAHLLDVVAYQTDGLLERPWLPVHAAGVVEWVKAFFQQTRVGLLLNPAAGLSSFGGFLGAFVCLLYWSYWTKRPRVPMLLNADALLFGLTFGWFFGRLGCFSAHDHPGNHTDFFLAVAFPGGPRHDLGLYEAMFAGTLTAAYVVLGRKVQRAGLYAALTCLLYGPVRFGLDFLRARDVSGADPRYFGLTPAQYGAVLVAATGVVLAVRVATSKAPAKATVPQFPTSAAPGR